ncbi:site-specific integrase [Photobacterium japonica]|uniref:site-specific integrase n=1 Tax=Photobacterium japonica TaxID=2910235 RepID=UPI003D114416
MGKNSAIQTYQRGKNAGGVAPDVDATLTTLAILFRRYRRKRSRSPHVLDTHSDVELLVMLYLWLTQQLSTLTTLEDIPDLKKIAGSQPCQLHCLRSMRDGGVSWVEYALAYPTSTGTGTGTGTVYLWQPIPVLFNALFQPFLASISYDTPWLSRKQKQALLQTLQKKWKTPQAFSVWPRVRKDKLFQYFTTTIQVDPVLSTTAKSVLLTTRQLHHHSAAAYQRENSDQLRFKIFHAHNAYLERLARAARAHQWHHYFDCTINGKTIALVQAPATLPPYLAEQGTIPQFYIDTRNGNRQKQIDNPLWIGSARHLRIEDVSVFFHRLQEAINNNAPGKRCSLAALKTDYNLRTYQLALLCSVLTGIRPTHAISLEKRRCFGGNTTVRDKGRFRPLWLCDYLQQKITDYQTVQQRLLARLPVPVESPMLWYLIDDNHQVEHLTAKTLRHFMRAYWPEDAAMAVPYQLRHFFAQCALSSTQPQLATHHIDRLMGHSQYGEHLGSDHLFPTCLSRIRTHLNQLPIYLHLR